MKKTELYRKATEATMKSIIEMMEKQNNSLILSFSIKQHYTKKYTFDIKHGGYSIGVYISASQIAINSYSYATEEHIDAYKYTYKEDDDHELVLSQYVEKLQKEISYLF